MRLPEIIESEILNSTEFASRYKELRLKLIKLSDEFSRFKKTKSPYRDAYTVYNFPMNLMKTIFLIKRLTKFYPESLPADTIRVIDIGCGEGAGMFGVYLGIGHKKFYLKGIDASSDALKQSHRFARALQKKDPNLHISYTRRRLGSKLLKEQKNRYDFVLFINALAEIIPADKIGLDFIKSAFRLLSKNGFIIIIEPALKKHSRRLMQLRELIIKHNSGNIILPCLHQNTCPLLKIKREWCHFVIPWEPPDFMQLLNKGLNREIDRLKFSYLIISRSGQKISGYTVISRLLTEKGKKKVFICTGQDRIELMRLNRDRSQKNSRFDAVKSGDFIEIKNFIQKGSLWQIKKDTEVKII